MNPDVRFGKPWIAGTRIDVATVVGLIAAVALRRASFGSESRNTFFHAEPTCLTIGPLT